MELPLWGLKIVKVIGRQLSLLRFLLFDFSLLLLSPNQKTPLLPPRLVPEVPNHSRFTSGGNHPFSFIHPLTWVTGGVQVVRG